MPPPLENPPCPAALPPATPQETRPFQQACPLPPPKNLPLSADLPIPPSGEPSISSRFAHTTPSGHPSIPRRLAPYRSPRNLQLPAALPRTALQPSVSSGFALGRPPPPSSGLTAYRSPANPSFSAALPWAFLRETLAFPRPCPLPCLITRASPPPLPVLGRPFHPRRPFPPVSLPPVSIPPVSILRALRLWRIIKRYILAH